MDETVLNTEKASWNVTSSLIAQQVIVEDSGITTRASSSDTLKRYELNSTTTDPLLLTWNSVSDIKLQVTIDSVITDGFILVSNKDTTLNVTADGNLVTLTEINDDNHGNFNAFDIIEIFFQAVSSPVSDSGGGSTTKGGVYQPELLSLLNIDFLQNHHFVTLGDVVEDQTMTITWNVPDDIEVTKIELGENSFTKTGGIVVFPTSTSETFLNEEGNSQSIIMYSFQVPSKVCDGVGTINCITIDKHDIPITITASQNGRSVIAETQVIIEIIDEFDYIPILMIILLLVILIVFFKRTSKKKPRLLVVHGSKRKPAITILSEKQSPKPVKHFISENKKKSASSIIDKKRRTKKPI